MSSPEKRKLELRPEDKQFLAYLKKQGLTPQASVVSHCPDCANYNEGGCIKHHWSSIPLEKTSFVFDEKSPAYHKKHPSLHCLNWRIKTPQKPSREEQIKTEEEEKREEPNLNEYHCLKNYFPLLKNKDVTEKKKQYVAEDIVSALHRQYPEIDELSMLEQMDNWNQQLRDSGIYGLSPTRKHRAIKRGFEEKLSCEHYNGILPLQKECTLSDCPKYDGTIERERTIIERLADEITHIRLFKGDNTEMTKDEYTIFLRDKSILLSHKQLMRPAPFIEKYLQVFGDLLKISPSEWYIIFNEIIKPKITEIIKGEKVETEEYYREMFVDSLHERGVVYSWNEVNRNSPVYNTKDSTLWVQTTIVGELKEQIGLTCSLRKLRSILNPVIARGVERKRIGGGGARSYFWIFKGEKLGIEPPIDKLDSYMNNSKERRK